MVASSELNENLRDRGLLALCVLVLARNPVTADVAESKAILSVDGTILRGTKAAEDVLIDALQADAAAWMQWLEEPAHSNAALSMTTVVQSGIRASLDEPLVAFFQDLAATRFAMRSVSSEIASTLTTEVIDIRDYIPQVPSNIGSIELFRAQTAS